MTATANVDAWIHEEFSPLKNVASLSIKDAIFEALKGAKGSLIEDVALSEAITTTIGGAVFGAGLGAIVGATAAVVTLPLNPYIDALTTKLVNTTLKLAGSIVKSHCSDPSWF